MNSTEKLKHYCLTIWLEACKMSDEEEDWEEDEDGECDDFGDDEE